MKDGSFFEGLNPEQAMAVDSVNGRLLILAGAGSGKTRVLTLRMVHLIQNLKVSPKAILGLTFTNKAAAEMQHRIASMVGPAIAKQVTLSTFHGFCMQILRQEAPLLGYTKEFSLYDEKDIQRLVTLIARDLLDRESEMPSLAPTIAAITQAKNQGLRPEDIDGTMWHDEFTRTVYKRLQASMRAYNAMDFDNLLWQAVELFEKFPDVLASYQDRYRYIMIDEYQDTNPIQYRLATLLSAKYGNLCVVGDDDQSIYGWRGASVKNILEFDNAKVIKLEQNYRSTNNILKASNAVIAQNKQRYQKVLWSAHGEGELIEVFSAPNEIEEAKAVVERIAKLKQDKGLRWKDIAILYRSNALSRQFEMALLQHVWNDGDRWIQGVPYHIFGGTEFYEKREVRDLFAYLRVIVNPSDQEALLRVINQPRRGIGDASLDLLTAHNRLNGIPLWSLLKDISNEQTSLAKLKADVSVKAMKGICHFVATIEDAKVKFAKGCLHEALQWLIEHINYYKAIDEEVKSTQMRDFKRENVQEFVNMLAEYEQMCHSEYQEVSLHDFLTKTGLDENWSLRNKSKDMDKDKVNLMTIHSSKGLEFPACFIVGVEDHIMPHEKSLMDVGLEEERRLMYVAITRAMRHLTLSMSQQRKRMGKDYSSRPSRFLYDIPKDLLNGTHYKWKV